MPTRAELKTLYQQGLSDRNMDPLFKTTGWGGLGRTARFVDGVDLQLQLRHRELARPGRLGQRPCVWSAFASACEDASTVK